MKITQNKRKSRFIDLFYKNVSFEFLFDKGRSCLLSLVSIGVGLECVRIDDSFVIHQLVPFVLWKREQFIGVRIPNNMVTVNNLCLSWLEEGSFYFVFDILTHDVIVELRVGQ